MLTQFGWKETHQQQFNTFAEQGLIPARVTAVFSWQYEIATSQGTFSAELSGKLRHGTLSAAKRPAIGDFLAVSKADESKYIIHAVLPRRSCLQRQQADGEDAQVIAANVDVCFLVQALQRDYNLARLARYVALTEGAGALPAVVLTKADLVGEVQQAKAEVQQAFPAAAVFVVSSLTGDGISEIQEFMEPGKTYVALGSSGVGKSTLLNALEGKDLMKTAEVREDDQRGRHTTTHRQLFTMANGALYIDTPGMRELALFEHEGLEASFRDINDFAQACKYKDCLHENEPGCVVRGAILAGDLDEKRLDTYRKMKKEEELYHKKQILLTKKVANTKKKRSKTHYKDYMRGGAMPFHD